MKTIDGINTIDQAIDYMVDFRTQIEPKNPELQKDVKDFIDHQDNFTRKMAWNTINTRVKNYFNKALDLSSILAEKSEEEYYDDLILG